LLSLNKFKKRRASGAFLFVQPPAWYNISMNLHPLIVHFPIALLTIYCLAELVRFRNFAFQSYMFFFKGVLVMVGGLATLAALYFGGVAKQLLDPPQRDLVSLHETFGQLTTALTGLIALAYLIAFINRYYLKIRLPSFVTAYSEFFLRNWVSVILAIVLLGLLFFTGALGASIIYGSNSDIFTSTIYGLFFH